MNISRLIYTTGRNLNIVTKLMLQEHTVVSFCSSFDRPSFNRPGKGCHNIMVAICIAYT